MRGMFEMRKLHFSCVHRKVATVTHGHCGWDACVILFSAIVRTHVPGRKGGSGFGATSGKASTIRAGVKSRPNPFTTPVLKSM